MKPFNGQLDAPPKPFTGTLDGETPMRRPSDVMKDAGVTALKGFIAVPEAAVGVADLITGGNAGKLAAEAGFRPSEARKFLDEQYSDAQKLANQNVQQADGFVPTVVEAVRNPSTIAHTVLESAPSILAGGSVARGAKALAPSLSPLAAGATGEAVVAAGSSAANIRSETPDGLLSPEQAALAAGSGAATGLLGATGATVARKLGISDIDTLVAGGPAQVANRGLMKRMAGGAVSEGVLEELPQSAQEQIAQNLALGKPWDEGVAQSAAMGMLAGGVMGAAGGMFTGRQPAAEAGAPAQPLAPTPPDAATPPLSFSFEDVTNIGARVLDQLRATPEDQLSPAQREEMDFLGANLANPQAIAEKYGFNMRGPEFTEDMLDKALGTMRAQAAMDEVVMKYQRQRDETNQPVNASILDMVNEARAEAKLAPLTPEAWQKILDRDETPSKPAANAEDAAKRVFPFSSEAAAERFALTRYKNGEPYTIQPHPAVAGRFAVIPGAAPVAAAKASAAASIDEQAHQAATSPKNDTPEPTQNQREAGNYKMGHVRVAGLDVSIENPQGSVRKGVDKSGKPWENTLAAHYGYIKGTVGKDKDHIDTFIGPNADAETVFVIDQVEPTTGKFDEHKVMMGFPDEASARKAYQDSYQKDWKGLKTITAVPMDEFKAWLKDGNTKAEFARGQNNRSATQTLSDKSGDWNFESAFPRPMIEEREAGGRSSIYSGTDPDALPGAVSETHQETLDSLRDNFSDIGILTAAIEKGVDPATDKSAKPERIEALRKELATAREAIEGTLEEYENEFGKAARAAFQKFAIPDYKTERRADSARRKKVDEMSADELRAALLTDDLTGLGNRRAYDEAKKLPVQVSIDLDALKWVNDNMGHESGDKLLAAMGEAMRKLGMVGYHLSGDEFAMQAKTQAEANAAMQQLREVLDEATIEVTLPDGSTISKKGVGFSYGTGKSLEQADVGLRADKEARERAGQRSSRGAEPAGVARQSPTGKRDQQREAAEVKVEPAPSDAGEDVAPLPMLTAEQAGDVFQKFDALFDPPGKGEVVRLNDKVKVYNAKHGWMTPAEAKKKIAEWKKHAADQYETHRNANSQKVVLSLFDLSGQWSQPWEDAGYDVYRFDIQEGAQYQEDINNFSIDYLNDMFGSFDGKDVHAILAACPCTDFAVSGARHFAAKDKDGRTANSIKLVEQTLAIIEYLKPATWAIENPVGRIQDLTGLPPWRLSFDPNHLGDPYTKKTLIWGRFNADLPIAPVEPTEGSKMHQKYGGKSLRTKNARSVTPEGFSYGFFMANNAVDNPAVGVTGKYDRLNRQLIEDAIKAGVTPEQIDEAVEELYYIELDDKGAEQAIRDLMEPADPPKTAPKTGPKESAQFRSYLSWISENGPPPVGMREIIETDARLEDGEAERLLAIKPGRFTNTDGSYFTVPKAKTSATSTKPDKAIIRPVRTADGGVAYVAQPVEPSQEEANLAARAVSREAYTFAVSLPDIQKGANMPREAFATLLRGTLKSWQRAESVNAANANDQTRAVAINAFAIDDETIDAIQKEAKQRAKEAEKQANRDPAVYQAQLTKAMNGLAEGEHDEFKRGFDHAVAGRTRSTLTGDLPLRGFDAARTWLATPEGKDYFQGKRRNKLENTGADLRRSFDEAKAAAEGAAGEPAAVLKALDKATTRANVFQPNLEGATPGTQRMADYVRSKLRTFKEYAVGTMSIWVSRSSSADKMLAMYMAKPENMQAVKDAAKQYLDMMQAVSEGLSGAKTVDELSQKVQDTFYPNGAESVRVDVFPGLLDYNDAQKLHVVTPTGASYGSFWINQFRTNEDKETAEADRANPLTRPRLDSVTRDGRKDYRQGKDITPQQFKETFGFADVGFGKWVNAKQDQEHLNYAYDSFRDLADLIGVEPKYIGLGGRLHFTIGALGHGKHAAHYQDKQAHPDGGTVPVINVTNTRCDGSVAHEWIHALDYALRQDSPDQSPLVRMLVDRLKARYDVATIDDAVEKFIRGSWYYKGGGLRKDDRIAQAEYALEYGNYGKPKPTAFKRNADDLGEDYWGNNEELLARAGEAWVFDKLGATANTYLVSDWVEDGKVTRANKYRGTPYPTAEERVYFNKLFDTFFESIEWTAEGPKAKRGNDLYAAAAREQEAFDDYKSDILAKLPELYRDFKKGQPRPDAKTTDIGDADRLIEEQRRREEQRLAMEASQAPTVTSDGALADDELSSLFDEAAAELRESIQEKPAAPAPGERVVVIDNPPPGGWTDADKVPRKKDDTAAALAKEAAKLGVTGIDEALKGLVQLFGGNSLKSFPAGFDEQAYAKAKPHFEAALKAFVEAGKTLKDLFKFLIQNFGEGVKPYAIQFAKEKALSSSLATPDVRGDNETEAPNVSDGQSSSRNDRDSDAGTRTADVPSSQGRQRTGRRNQAADDTGQADLFADAGGTAEGGSALSATTPGDGPVGGQNDGAARGRGDRAGAGDRVPERKRADNYVAERGSLARVGSWRATAARNLDIVELVKKIEAEGRPATKEEQATLVKFTGWGASEIAQNLFPQSDYYAKADWKELVERRNQLMSDEEKAEAKRTTQYAHYTSEDVIRGIWGAVERMGFEGGNILEPGMGVGLFPIAANPDVMARSRYTGIEYDSFTAKIAKALLPAENIIKGDYTKTKLPKDFFDLAIGNPPFGSVPITDDPEYGKNRFFLHDYFFAKTIDRVRPGGLMVLITSRGTMDKGGVKARQYLSERADLLGAVRLPQTAFKDNAGTEVVTDIIFMQKREPGQPQAGQPWQKLQEVEADGQKVLVNEYFAANPDMVLGRHSTQGSMYKANEYTVLPPDAPIEKALATALDRLPKGVFQRQTDSKALVERTIERDFNPKSKKEGTLYVSDAGHLMRVESGSGVDINTQVDKPLTDKEQAWLKDYAGLRDAVKQAQYDQLTDGEWEGSLKSLNKAYDAFVKKHGSVRDFTKIEREEVDEDTGETKSLTYFRWKNAKLLFLDVESPIVEMLEHITEDDRIVKAPFLKERTIKKPTRPEINSTKDALMVTLDERGTLDLDYLAQLAKKDRVAVVEELGNLIYDVPGAGWKMADEYLSGDVVAKLEEAEAAVKIDSKYQRNVEALLRVQPKPLGPKDITIRMGQGWVPVETYEQFAEEVLGETATLTYVSASNTWMVEGGRGKFASRSSTSSWGTPDRSPLELLQAGLMGSEIKIQRKDSDGKTYTDKDATAAAAEKLKLMQEEFGRWVWQDAKRGERLAALYNRLFNNLAPRKFDGSHLTLPGLSLKYKLYDHQKRAIWRVVQTGNTYLAHAVGAGKTLEMIVAGMEMKRLGLVSKPMYAVPKHMLKQFAAEFLDAYPAANILVADDKNFDPINRGRFVAQAALNNPDAIIITHPAFTKLSVKDESRQRVANRFIGELQAAIEDEGDRFRRKEMEAQLERLERRFEAKKGKKDNVVDFEDLGVDFIFIDEAHEFRKLDFISRRGNIKGIDPNGSARALDLFVKVQHLEHLRPGRSAVLASGTPVVNTMAELYSIMRMMDMGQIERDGLDHFDVWANNFGDIRRELEQNAAGGYEFVERFAQFVNVPELMKRVRSFMDVLTSSQLGELVKRPDLEGGTPELVITPLSPRLGAYLKTELAQRIETSRKWKPSPEQQGNPDPLINIITDGRLAAIDMRFVDNTITDDPDSKLNRMLQDIVAKHKAVADRTYTDKETGKPEVIRGGTQIVFSAVGFGEQVAKSRGFDIKAEILKQLGAGGIKRDQIAFMDEFATDAKKATLFKDMRSGKVKVLFGSPKNMGTGLNVQKRLSYLHFLAPPWYPADIEQPHGRILRQGNQNSVVGIKWYATKGTYDSTMWQMVSRKAKFIEQAFTGDDSVRKLEDVSESSQYEMASALSSGDQRAIQLAGLNSDIERLTRLQNAHHDEQNVFRGRRSSGQFQIKQARERLEKFTKAKKVIGDYVSEFALHAGKDVLATRANIGEFVRSEMDRIMREWTPKGDTMLQMDKSAPDVEIGKVAGKHPLMVRPQVLNSDDEGNFNKIVTLRLELPEGISYPIEQSAREPMNLDPSGLYTRIKNKLNALATEIYETEARIVGLDQEIEKLESRIGVPFQFEQDLFDKMAEAALLKTELAGVNQQKEGEAADATPTVDSGGTPAQRRSGSGRGMSATRVKQSLAAVTGRLGVPIRVHQTIDQLRAATAIDWLEADTIGLAHRGQIHLVADNVSSPMQAELAAFHEAFHVGFRHKNAEGTKEYSNALRAIAVKNENVRTRAMEWRLNFGADLQERLTSVYGMKADKAREFMVLRSFEEALADMSGEAGGRIPFEGARRIIAAVQQWLRAMGFNRLADWLESATDAEAMAIILDARGQITAEPSPNVSAAPAFMQKEPVWYSALSRAVGSMKQGAAPAEQWKGLIRNLTQKGVKQDEIEWSGVMEWLDTQQGKVTKEAIQDYLNQNGVQVEEVMLGGESSGRARRERELRAMSDADFAYELEFWTEQEYEPGASRDNLIQEIIGAQEEDMEFSNLAESEGEAKFGQWQLPGGENYRELLLTLPQKHEAPNFEGWTTKYVGGGAWQVIDKDGQGRGNIRAERDANPSTIIQQWYDSPAGSGQRVTDKINAGNFRSSHFDQPNILAHVRFNERTDAEGKRVLFIEETQSDWAQKGKKDGFGISESQVKDLTRKRDSLRSESMAAYDSGDMAKFNAKKQEYDATLRQLERARGVVPPAPFVGKTEAWVALAVKRMIRYAAENGFDRVAFTTGEQQAARYDLSKQVDRIDYDDRTGNLVVTDIRNRPPLTRDGVKPEDLPDIIGKEAADRLMKNPDTSRGFKYSLAGEGLKVGGEGMLTFYDKIVPNVVNDVLKKLGGGKVANIRIPQGDGPAQAIASDADGGGEVVVGNRTLGFYDNMDMARAAAEAYNEQFDAVTLTQPGFDITPAMREKAIQGLPMFSRPRQPQVQTESPEFKRWFGDSKVVDADGKPMVVYHGTGADIQAFDLDVEPNNYESDRGKFFFTSDPGDASGYAETARGNANVVAAYLSLKNPRIETTGLDPADWWDRQPAYAWGIDVVDQGHDGLVVRGADGKVLYVASRPEQIKSAIGNRGTFDPSIADIAQMRIDPAKVTESAQRGARALASMGKNVRDLKGALRRISNANTDRRGLWLQLLGRRQITEMYSKLLPQLSDYNVRMQSLDAEKNESSAESDAIVRRWEKLPDAPQLADLMHDATLAQVDPDKPQPFDISPDVYQPLRDRFVSLSPDAQAVYRDARDQYVRHWEKVQDAMQARIDRLNAKDDKKRAMKEEMRKELSKSLKGVYFPLSRFGEYIVVAKDERDETLAVRFAESMTEAETIRQEMVAEYPRVSKVLKRKEYNAARDSVSKGFINKLFDVVEVTAQSEEESIELKDAINQLYLSSIPDLSWAKHGIHRKGTAGFSRDARRAFAHNMFHGAYYLAKLRHTDVLAEQLRDMQAHVDDRSEDAEFDSVKAQQIVDEMQKRHDLTMNPDNNPVSQFLTSMGFVWFLGLSPASAVVNLSQTVLVAGPLIGARYGFTKASQALGRVSAEIVQAKNDLGSILRGDEKLAFDRAAAEGVIDLTMAHDLAGISEGRDNQLSGSMAPVIRAAAFMFHHAERFNRQATFMSIYRLAREKGDSHDQAFETARDMTYKSQFDYSASNRPRAMMGPVARVVLLFKQYAQNMIYTLVKSGYDAAKGDREALRAFSALLTAHALAAGALGLPVVGTILAAASALGSSDDEPWDAEVALRNYLADAVGPDLAEVLVRGVPRAFLPGDLSGRVGLDQLVMRDGNPALEGAAWYTHFATEMLGPVIGIGLNAAKGTADFTKGDYLRGMEAMLPSALGNSIKALRYNREGVKDKTGVEIVADTTAIQEITQLLGFSPAQVREAYEGKSAIMNEKREIERRRKELLRDLSRAVLDRDDDARVRAFAKIIKFNQAQPEFRITSETMRRSIQERAKRQALAKGGVYLPNNKESLRQEGRFANSD